MQDMKTDKDEVNCNKVNEALNNPNTALSSAGSISNSGKILYVLNLHYTVNCSILYTVNDRIIRNNENVWIWGRKSWFIKY